jgi:RNA 3'-terminal phosphate cyclase (ATP)
MLAREPSRLTLEGGTHNPLAPPFDFLARSFLPIVQRMGPRIDFALERHGFFPAGGGCLTATIQPTPELGPIELLERGAIRSIQARALVSRLSPTIADRQINVVARRLNLDQAACHAEVIGDSPGPGNALLVAVESEHVTEVFTGFGEKGLTAETVAQDVCADVRNYMMAEVPVGRHLADQLLVPVALAGRGAFRTIEPTPHSRTNAAVIQRFLDVDVRFSEDGRRAWRVDLRGRS